MNSTKTIVWGANKWALETLFNVCFLKRCPHCSKCKIPLVAISQNKYRISISLKRFPKYQFTPQGKPWLPGNNQWCDDSSIVDTVILSTQRYTCCRSLVVCIVEMKSCERFTLLMPIQLTIIIFSFYAQSVLNL